MDNTPNFGQVKNPMSKDNADVADTGLADVGLPAPSGQPATSSSRPQLARNQPAPPPPHQPPPPPAPQQIGNPTDSLSLMQLRRIVTEFPRAEPVAYAFNYDDTASYEEEIDEWFTYGSRETSRLTRARQTFERRWRKAVGKLWLEASDTERKTFVTREIGGLSSSNIQRRSKSLQTLLHIVLGVWDETAGAADEQVGEVPYKRSAATIAHTDAIRDGVVLLSECDGISRIYDVTRRAFEGLWDYKSRNSKPNGEDFGLLQEELDNVTTILYVTIETTRKHTESMAGTYKSLATLRPALADYMVTLVAKLRWEETNELPQARIFLMFWKTILLMFGGTATIEKVKAATREASPSQDGGEDLITATPLDYHIFRQEITSKYPAYAPPATAFPFEMDSNTIVPPLPNHPVRYSPANGIIPRQSNNSGGASILNQPVHIATPAPSPPPSPGVGGKAGKKQNYQTNQNFPFMYPPLDSSSNSAGGKGLAGLQEALVGRKWEGSEIPASILEAGELFSKRTKMTRATRQLWDERERFLKFERGWDGKKDRNCDVEDFDLDAILGDNVKDEEYREPPEVDYGPNGANDDIKEHLDRIEAFYRASIPHLQSMVIVLLKAVLANVTALITQPLYPQNQSGIGTSFPSDSNLRGGPQGQRRLPDGITDQNQSPAFDITDLATQDLDALRFREITGKAVSGILLTLMKWFKVSHVLKSEYLTQLLLDSNYLPLALKLFAHSEIDKVVDCNADRLEYSFFHFCNEHSISSIKENESSQSEEDDAAPPPIKLKREPADSRPSEDQLPSSAYQQDSKPVPQALPETDELGNVVGDLPLEPKEDYSWRNFFAAINYLRIMQKVCKNKAHRNLLLVQYKSSNILKKALKIPQHELRLYTLKLFKGQVPYCGRKWRQGNMRVITAVYLHCRPELRDDWLAGSDVEAEVDEALPLEQALRSLTHWHNVTRYPEQMGADIKLLESENDFFARELEKMDLDAENDFDEGDESQWDGSVDIAMSC